MSLHTEMTQEEIHGYAPTDASPRGLVHGIVPRLDMWKVGDIVFARMQGEQLETVRSPARIEASPSDSIKLAYLDAGRGVIQQGDRETYLETGDFTLVDSSRPYRYFVDKRFAVRAFQFSKAAIGISDADISRVTATALSQEHSLSAYLMPFLKQLSARDVNYHPSTRMQLARNVTDILGTLIHDRLNDMPLEDSARRTLMVRIKAFIIDHLDLPELSPELIATAHFISVRYLHKLFASEDMSVSRWTLAARLDRCRRDLASDSPNSSAIFGVARQWGFSSPAHFSRAFRASFGMSPSEWQATARFSKE